jgi:hypothetical protein
LPVIAADSDDRRLLDGNGVLTDLEGLGKFHSPRLRRWILYVPAIIGHFLQTTLGVPFVVRVIREIFEALLIGFS